MDYGYLGPVLGNNKARRFFVATIIAYFVFTILFSYFLIGSITEVMQSIVFGIDRGENLTLPIILAGIVSPICTRVAIRLSAGENKTSRVILDIITLGITIPIVGIILLFVLGGGAGVFVSLIFDEGTITPEMAFNILTLVAFGIPGLFLILITWNILPGQKADKMKRTHSELKKIEEKAAIAKADLYDRRHADSLRRLENAKKDFEDIQREEPPTEGTSERINTTRSRIDEVSEQIVEKILSEIEEQTLSGNHIEAHELLSHVDQTDIRYDDFSETIDSLREDIDKNLSNAVSAEIDRMKESIERAKQATKKGEFKEARDQLDVSGHKATVAEIDSEYIPAEFYELSNQQSRIRSDIIQKEREAKIQSHSEEIADLLEINASQVKLNTDEPELYQELEETLIELDELKQEYPNQSWDQLNTHIKTDITETNSGTSSSVQIYTEIISDSGEILRYIETAGQSHPAIHPTEWRKTVDMAIEEMTSDSLKPLISEVEQLKEGIWEREHLYQMSWQEFEHLIGSLYDSLGYRTEVTQGTSDMGVDVWAERDGVRQAIQVKQFGRGNPVGREPLQKTVSAIAKGDAHEAVVITSSRFTRTAIEYAADFGPGLELISGEKLIEKLSLSDVPPPTSETSNVDTVDTATHEEDNTPSDIGTPLPEKNTHWNNKSKYPYDNFPDATEDIKELKRNQEHDKAEELLLWCINYAESEARSGQRGHARWYYKHLAIIYRKDHRYQDEIDILQRYVSFCNSMNIEPRDEIVDRLNDAKQVTTE